jgi:two-component system chemotaxis response regulator CheB
VIVQHRTPLADTALIELLTRACPLTVEEPCDHDPLEAGHVYVAPCDYHCLIEPGHIALSVDAPVNFARPSIDVLFESHARAYGDQSIAFMLTGASQDGAAGATAVKRAGGRVFVEDPARAHSPIAPRATLAMIEADAVLPIEQLATVLAELGRADTLKMPRPSPE